MTLSEQVADKLKCPTCEGNGYIEVDEGELNSDGYNVLTRKPCPHCEEHARLEPLLALMPEMVEALEKYAVHPLPAPGPIGNEPYMVLAKLRAAVGEP